MFAWITRDGSMRGLHPNVVIVDDIDDVNDSAYMMNKYYADLHTTVMGAVEPFEGVPEQILVCGNYTGEYCAMIAFQKRDAVGAPDRWIVRAIPALEEGDTVQWTGVPPGTSTWPERRSTEWLLAKRREMNAGRPFAFEMEYQNKIVSISDRIWDEDMFRQRYDQLPPRHALVTRVYIDSAQKMTEAGDETAIVKYSKCVDGPDVGKYYRREARLGHLAPDEIAKEVLAMFVGNGTKQNPECDGVYLESKTKLGEDSLAAYIKMYARQNSVNMIVHQLVPAEHGDKRQRSVKAVSVGRAGAIWSPVNESPDQIRCRNQMVMFTGKKVQNMPAIDDGHDAEVWALIDLQTVTDKSSMAVSRKPVPVKGHVRAVA